MSARLMPHAFKLARRRKERKELRKYLKAQRKMERLRAERMRLQEAIAEGKQ